MDFKRIPARKVKLHDILYAEGFTIYGVEHTERGTVRLKFNGKWREYNHDVKIAIWIPENERVEQNV